VNTKLTAITQSLIEGENLSPEELIVFIARVSNPDNQMNLETADRLIRYLIKNKHWSPFEHVSLTVEIKTSRAIAAQILRHRSFVFQEFSQRYSSPTAMEPVQLRKQADKNRQSSSDKIENPEMLEMIQNHLMASTKLYNDFIEKGVARECARMVLPLTTQTTIYMTGSIRSWIHYLEQRCSEHTQLEHRQIAFEIRELLIPRFPNLSKAIGWTE
jgi:thymidylate synthase (FAD)